MNALITPRPWPLARRPLQLGDLAAVAVVEAGAYGHPWSRGNFIDSLAAGYIAELLESPKATTEPGRCTAAAVLPRSACAAPTTRQPSGAKTRW